MVAAKLPEHLMWRLNLVRGLLLDAVSDTGNQIPIGRMKAALGFDQAIELMLTTLLPPIGVSVSRDWSLSRMLSEFCTSKPELSSHKTPVERLRRLRNQVQHDGVVPSQEDARLMMVVAEAFIRDSVREVCGKELEELSPVNLITDEEVREHFIGAENAISLGHYQEAAKEAAVAFYMGWSKFKLNHPDYFSIGEKLTEVLFGEIRSATSSAARAVHDQSFLDFASNFDQDLSEFSAGFILDSMFVSYDLARIGVDISEYVRFSELTPYVFGTMGGPQPQFSYPKNWAPTQQDALFVLDFTFAALLKFQSRVSDSDL